MLVYPVTDAGVNTPSYAEFDEGHGLTAAAMRRFWGLYLNGGTASTRTPRRCVRSDLTASRPRTSSPPATTSCATRARPTRPRCERAGVPVTLKRLEGTIHGFWRWQTTAVARAAVREAAAAVRAALG